MGKVGKWALNVLIGIDQLGNALTGGDPDETISSRLGKMKFKHGGEIPWYRPMSRIVDWGLDKIDPGHSIDAIEPDEGKDAVVDNKMLVGLMLMRKALDNFEPIPGKRCDTVQIGTIPGITITDYEGKTKK